MREAGLEEAAMGVAEVGKESADVEMVVVRSGCEKKQETEEEEQARLEKETRKKERRRLNLAWREKQKTRKREQKEKVEGIQKEVDDKNKSSKDRTWSAVPNALLGVISSRIRVRAGQRPQRGLI